MTQKQQYTQHEKQGDYFERWNFIGCDYKREHFIFYEDDLSYIDYKWDFNEENGGNKNE